MKNIFCLAGLDVVESFLVVFVCLLTEPLIHREHLILSSTNFNGQLCPQLSPTPFSVLQLVDALSFDATVGQTAHVEDPGVVFITVRIRLFMLFLSWKLIIA